MNFDESYNFSINVSPFLKTCTKFYLGTCEQVPCLHPCLGLHCLHVGPEYPLLSISFTKKTNANFLQQSNFVKSFSEFLPAAALTRPGAGALAWDATFGTNGRRAKKSLPAFLAVQQDHKKVAKKLILEITVEATRRIFAPCRGTGKAVDRCHGHNPAVGRNPDSHRVK